MQSRLTAALGAGLLLSACHHDQEFRRHTTVLPDVPSVYVRATPDSDASTLIGAFIPDEVDDTAIAESRAARLRCSDYIHVKKVPASGDVEEVMAATSGLSGKIGVASLVKFGGGRSTADALRVQYTAIEKLEANVDTKGLSECCRIAPNECTHRFIANAIMADGRIYVATEEATDADLGAQVPVHGVPVDADVVYKDGFKWERKTSFKHQYFAFSVQRGRLEAPAADASGAPAKDSCEWANAVPESLDGQYFVGVSNPSATEAVARDFALRNAREQVIKYLGEYLTQQSETKRQISGDVAALGGTLDDLTTQQALSEGVARMVKDRKWCAPEKIDTPKGSMNVVKVLAFFPNSERSAAARVALTNLIELKKKKNDLTPEQEKSIRAIIESLQQ